MASFAFYNKGPSKKRKIEFGDFQTPGLLAERVCELLVQMGMQPKSIVEPNCGTGAFVEACLKKFGSATRLVASDINPEYVAETKSLLKSGEKCHSQVTHADFYTTDWNGILRTLPDPMLVVGNPPWVTNAGVSVVGGSNLPLKSNFQGHSGLDAVTGKSNFDISEWMLIRECEWLNGRHGTLAMLCKTAVARKVLFHAWKNHMQIVDAAIYRLDAMAHFGAAVDACLLVCMFVPSSLSVECRVYRSMSGKDAEGTFGFRAGRLVSDIGSYEQSKFLSGSSHTHRWRSGVKHDCASVMEFTKIEGRYHNALGEEVELEPNFVYPMLKGSGVANGAKGTRRWMLVTQRGVGEDTEHIRDEAPNTWAYLKRHTDRLGRRASSIYKGRPQFSIFGVGEYTFAPWKVAICALYKRVQFRAVGPIGGKPVVFDDTCYFIPCPNKESARFLEEILNSAKARQFYSSLVFWDAKRPLTIEILRQLDPHRLAEELCSGVIA